MLSLLANRFDHRTERRYSLFIEPNPFQLMTPAGRSARRRSGVARAFVATGLGSLMISLDVSVANSLLPAMSASFGHPGRAALSWVITAYAIAFAAVLVPAGRLADRVGRRRVCRWGLVAFAGASVACGLAPDLPVMVVGRVIQGAGAAALSPASLGLLLQVAAEDRRSVWTARWAGAGALGIGSGPIVGGVATELLSWRAAFLLNVPLAAIAVVASLGLPESVRHPGRRLPDPLGVVLLAGGTAVTVLAIAESPSWGLANLRTGAALALAAVVLVGFVRRSLRVEEPLLDLRPLGDRATAAITAVTFGYSVGFFGLLYSFVAFLVGVWKLSLVDVGLALLPLPLVVVPLTLGVGHLAGRVGFRPPIAAGASLMAVGLLAQTRIAAGGDFRWPWLLAAAVVGLGVGLCYPLLGAAAVAGLPASQLAAVSAVNQCARQVGAAVGIATTVALLGPSSTAASFHRAWVVTAACCGVAAAATRLMARSTTPVAVEPAAAELPT